ncbi:BTAD domain-containing putative transcriptional regulator [Brevibacterium daeguense]|uniref:BTAD domain-containing putative transcriptional regulator n=1 Tax=Brevibacterium daeguense TaxID=909936 RepID=A0ABP8EID2_9MICO|nr:BTAD domain-containing putative transcriptional regulator [Brevibacterium daeguense]
MAEPPVDIGVLGPLEIRRAGARVELRGARPRTALAALVIQAPHPLSVDALIDAVWGEHVPDHPRGAVHTVVSRLRGVLGADAVQAGPAGYCLALPAEAVDAARFEALRRRAADRTPSGAAALLDEAVALWRGPAYAEFADRPFAIAEAARLEELRMKTVEERAVVSLELGSAAEAVVPLRRLVAEQPVREHAHGLLMTALYRCGRPAEALDQYQLLRRTLAEELGLDPSPALRDLQLRILGHDLPLRSPSPTSDATPPAGESATRAFLGATGAFIGREADIDDLVAAVAVHRLVCITGPGGVGKTRLVAEALPELTRRLGRPAAVVELDDAAPGQVAARVASVLGLGTALGPRPAVLEYLSASALILVLDGCERVLTEVQSLVEAVRRTAARVHIVVTSRQSLSPGVEQVIPLAPLPAPDAAEAPERAALAPATRLFADRLRRLRPGADLTAPVLAMIGELCRRLDGLPLALELAAAQAAVLGVRSVLDELDAGHDPADGVRGSLRSVVARSHNLLSAPDRALLGRLSVFVGAFDLTDAEQVAPTGSAARAGLSRLVRASLVVPVDDGAGMRHRLLGIVRAFAAEHADAAAPGMYWQWAADCSERWAAEAVGPRCEEALTRLDRARADLASAASSALIAGRVTSAARIVGHLGLCTHWVPGPALAEVMLQVGEHPDLPGAPAEALALGAAALAAVERGDLARANRLGIDAERAARTPRERFLALTSLSIAAVYAGTRDAATRNWRQVLAIAGLDDGYRVDAHGALALVLAAAGELREADEQAAAAREAAERSGATARIAFALYASGEVLLITDPEAAAEVLREAARLADRVRAEQISGVARVALLSVLTRSGRTREAADLARILLGLQQRSGHWPQLWTTLRILAESFAAAGRLESAELVLAAAEAAASAPGLAGGDIERYRRLRERVRAGLGPDRANRIDSVARLLPRTEVLARARDAAEELLT